MAVHLGLQQQPHGLGAPTGGEVPQQGTNPYVVPNIALQANNAKLTGHAQAELQAAHDKGAQIGLNAGYQQGAMDGAQQGFNKGLEQPQQFSVETLASAIASNKLTPDVLQAMIADNKVTEEAAAQAVSIAMGQQPMGLDPTAA